MDEDILRAFAQMMQAQTLTSPDETSNVDKARLLLLRHQAYSTQADLKPGMLVRQKDGLGAIRASAGPIVLWRLLDMTHPVDLALATSWVTGKSVDAADCLVGYIVEDRSESTVVIVPASLKMLEPV